MTGRRLRFLGRGQRTLALAAALLAIHVPRVARTATLCSGGRFVVDGDALVGGSEAVSPDAVVLTQSFASIASGCSAAAVSFRASGQATVVRAVFPECREPGRRFVLKGRLDRTCTTLRGTLRSAGRQARPFTARLSTPDENAFAAEAVSASADQRGDRGQRPPDTGRILPPAHGRRVDDGVPGVGEKKVSEEAASDPTSSAYLLYHNNAVVQLTPRIYVSYWGDWSSTNDRYGVANQLYYFYKGLGGSVWNGVLTQYGQGCTANSTGCPSTAKFITNPTNQLKGWWKDTSTVPTTPTRADLVAAARRAAAHFGDNDYNAQYVIALPPGHGDSRFVKKGGTACAWHASTTSNTGAWITFTSLPYMPDAGTSCGMYAVNTGNAGLLDGVTILAGHEYAETVTDPFVDQNGYAAWYDKDGDENADKCIWKAQYNAHFSTGTFAVQSTWSNYYRRNWGNGCLAPSGA